MNIAINYTERVLQLQHGGMQLREALDAAAVELLLSTLRDVDEACQQGLNSAEPAHWEAALQEIMLLVRTADALARPRFE